MSNKKEQMLIQYLDKKLPDYMVNWEQFKTLLQGAALSKKIIE